MADIALKFDDFRGGDLVLSGQDLQRDDGIESAVLVSLFTDRRALPEQAQAALGQDTDLRGWWGDFNADVEGDRTGSLLWLLQREKQTAETLSRARQYASESLAWMTEDKVATAIDVQTEYLSAGVMGIAITIARPNGAKLRYRYDYEWAAQAAKRASN